MSTNERVKNLEKSLGAAKVSNAFLMGRDKAELLEHLVHLVNKVELIESELSTTKKLFENLLNRTTDELYSGLDTE